MCARYDNYGPLDARFLVSGDSAFYKFNNRLRPDQLPEGTTGYSSNGRMDIDGAWQTRKGHDVLGTNISSTSEAIVIPFYLYANVYISSATRVDSLVTIETVNPHGFLTNTQVGISGLSGTTDPNGNRTITVTSSTEFTFTIPGATGSETYSGTSFVLVGESGGPSFNVIGISDGDTFYIGGNYAFAGAPFISANTNACYGSCLFSDPNSTDSEYIVLALNENALAVNLATAATTVIAYPSGISITSSVFMLQTFGKVLIFRDGATALEWDGDLSGTPAFTKVANGNYTQPVVFSTANNTACSSGVVTVTEAAHGLSVGQKVTIMDSGTTGLVDGDEYVVASVPGSGSFTFYASIDDFSATSVALGKRQSNGRGFTHMPAPAWGVYHQRRLIVPFAYTTTGTSGSEVITARSIKDELLFSDILDSDTYDQLQNQFRVTAGIADYLQYVHPFTDDAAIAFCRNSIHLITGLSGSLTDLAIKEITREAGLVARKSVVTIGNRIFFLSDNGVYATEFGDLYNLRGAGLPLSAEIEPLIRRINTEYGHLAVGIFHNNRYYIAVPLDSSRTNNAILVYNLLNGGWESVDTVQSTGWDVQNLISAGGAEIKKLYAVNRFGGVHVLESREDDVDRVYVLAGSEPDIVPISSYVTTREYNMGSADRKKFVNFTLQVESSESNASNGTISVQTDNIDEDVTLGTVSSYYGGVLPVAEDADLRGRIGNLRAYGLQMTIAPTQGRPKVRMVKVEAINAFQSTSVAS